MVERKRQRFLSGLALAWVPWFPMMIGLFNVFRGISREKATGLAVVAGGLTETFLLFGIFATVSFEIGAIIVLVRTFESGHWLRNLLAAISTTLAVVMLLVTGLFLWMVWFQTRRLG